MHRFSNTVAAIKAHCIHLFWIEALNQKYITSQLKVAHAMHEPSLLLRFFVACHLPARHTVWVLAMLRGKAALRLLQVLPAGASKGKGVEQLLQHLNVKPERVLAMGDGENDKVMLQVQPPSMRIRRCSTDRIRKL